MTREELLKIQIDEIGEEKYSEIKEIIDKLPKPVNGLGKFEDLICKIACAQKTTSPDISKKALILMFSDNGIIEEGVTEEGGYVTGLIANKIADGKAAISIMAKEAGVKIVPVDIGINGEINNKNIIDKKIANGTKNFLKEPAMSEEQLMQAINTGIELVTELKNEGTGIICTGEMGIGNSTTAISVICGIIEGDPQVLTNRGIFNISDAGLERKIDVIFKGLHEYGYDVVNMSFNNMDIDNDGEYNNDANKVLDILRDMGGFDIAGLTGVFIGCALNNIPVVIDDIASAAAALAAENILSGCKQYYLGSHYGKEVATELVFEELEIDPVINANMLMSVGAGSVMLMPMLDMVIKAYNGLQESDSIELDEF